MRREQIEATVCTCVTRACLGGIERESSPPNQQQATLRQNWKKTENSIQGRCRRIPKQREREAERGGRDALAMEDRRGGRRDALEENADDLIVQQGPVHEHVVLAGADGGRRRNGADAGHSSPLPPLPPLPVAGHRHERLHWRLLSNEMGRQP